MHKGSINIHVCDINFSMSRGYFVSRCHAVGSSSFNASRRQCGFWLASCTCETSQLDYWANAKHKEMSNTLLYIH